MNLEKKIEKAQFKVDVLRSRLSSLQDELYTEAMRLGMLIAQTPKS